MSTNTQFYKLKLKNIQAETKEAAVFTFDLPSELEQKFVYKQGQYLTLRFNLNGKEERRAYSLCSSPAIDKDLKIGVKRVKGGLISNYLNDQLKVGDEIEVMSPQGTFYTKLDATQKKEYFLFGCGSGITPLISILKTVLEQEPKSQVFLYYGNRNEESILFKSELDQLVQRYKGQLTVEYILSKPSVEVKKSFLGIFNKKVIDWKGQIGRIDAYNTEQFITKYKALKDIECFSCGPLEMMETVEKTLLNLGIEAKQIHKEWFASAEGKTDKKTQSITTNGAEATIHLDGEEKKLSIKAGESVLDAMLRNDIDAPYSCMSGACSTCIGRLVKGTVEMERCLALSEEEIKEGLILTCAAVPTSEHIEISCDDI